MKTSQLSRWLVIGFLAAGIFGWSATGELVYARLVYVTAFLVLGAFLWFRQASYPPISLRSWPRRTLSRRSSQPLMEQTTPVRLRSMTERISHH